MSSLHSHLKTFADPELPETIYFDSSFVVKTLVGGLSYHQECMDFIRRLEAKQPIVVVSKMSKLELWCAAIRIGIHNLFIKRGVPEPDLDDVLYNYPNLIQKFHKQVTQIQKDFENLLQRFVRRIEEDINDEIINKAHDVMNKYNLGSYDSVHIATMEYWKMKDIAAFDHAIEDITDFNIWTCGGSRRHKTRLYKRSKLSPLN